ncbi:MAG: polysaccharide biosynthesis/export family protein [Planctomycetia bacterium]|nr:polysaccharide biosynthesis/export family protein [Planctomycetia bacterium]
MLHCNQIKPYLNGVWLLLLVSVLLTGCRPFDHYDDPLGKRVNEEMEPPRELSMMSLPAYRIAPPDVVTIELQKMVPKPPYFLQTLDVLYVRVLGTLYDQPIDNYYVISAEGTVDLGPSYGALRVEGLTVDGAREAIRNHLTQVLRAPEVAVSLAQMSAMQPINGQYQIGPDGTVNLRYYGTVHVAGMTLMEAKFAIEEHLSHYLNSPIISMDVVAYNSKSYYVITQGAGNGDSVRKIPVTGNETVLDAIAQIGGMSQLSSQKIWIARPAPGDFACEQRLPVDWEAISSGASTATNYQIMPNDRVFIVQDNFTATSNWIGKVMSPFERAAGVISLGTNTARNIRNIDQDYGYGYGGGY